MLPFTCRFMSKVNIPSSFCSDLFYSNILSSKEFSWFSILSTAALTREVFVDVHAAIQMKNTKNNNVTERDRSEDRVIQRPVSGCLTHRVVFTPRCHALVHSHSFGRSWIAAQTNWLHNCAGNMWITLKASNHSGWRCLLSTFSKCSPAPNLRWKPGAFWETVCVCVCVCVCV